MNPVPPRRLIASNMLAQLPENVFPYSSKARVPRDCGVLPVSCTRTEPQVTVLCRKTNRPPCSLSQASESAVQGADQEKLLSSMKKALAVPKLFGCSQESLVP